MSAEHGYGVDTDCICGRNFDKVRGLREHITKARTNAARCTCDDQWDPECPEHTEERLLRLYDAAQQETAADGVGQ